MLFLGWMAAVSVPGFAAENTATTLSITANDAGPRTLASLTAHVAANEAPSGVVNFRSGDLDLGSAFVDGDGNASLKTDILPAGNHRLVAVYLGADGYESSRSAEEPVHANASTTVAGFTVAASPTSLSTAVGGFVSSTITVTPVNGLNALVSLSCDGLPVNATCTFTPLNVQASCAQTCTPVTSVMQIQTLSPSTASISGDSDGSAVHSYAFVFPALFGLAGLGAWKRRGWRNLALALLAFAGTMGMTACNARYNYLNHGPPGNPGTPAGSYTITVEAESSNGSQTITPATEPQIALTITAAKS
jgi:hypothetical protein